MDERGNSNQLVFVICCLLVISFIFPLCTGAGTPMQPVQNQIVIFSGQIPYGDGNVSIRTDSGVLYQVPVMTPVGIIQALAGTGMIDEYHVGDELLEKRGIFTLDGINSYAVNEYDTWYVTVNGIQLREFLLPAKEGLNTYQLEDGDDVLFAFGDPTLPVSAAKALIWVQIGNKNGMMSYLSPLQMPASYQVLQTPVPTVIPTVELTVAPTPVPATVSTTELNISSTPIPTAVATVEVTVAPTPIPTAVATVEVTVAPTPVPTAVATVEVTVAPTPVPTAVATVEVTVAPTPVPTVVATVDVTLAPTPVPTAVATVEVTPDVDTELVNDTSVIEEVTNESETILATEKSEDNRILYSGVYALPEGTVNITVNSGLEYEIPVNTPLGVLHLLLKDALINNLAIDERGMHKGGILILEGVNEFFNTANKIWYVKVNGNILEDYQDPKTEGLNIFTFGAGDTVTYYYGNPDEPLNDAEAVIIVTLE